MGGRAVTSLPAVTSLAADSSDRDSCPSVAGPGRNVVRPAPAPSRQPSPVQIKRSLPPGRIDLYIKRKMGQLHRAMRMTQQAGASRRLT